MATQTRVINGEIEMVCANCQQYRHSEYEINYCEECGMAVCHEDDCHLKGCGCIALARILFPEEHAAMWASWMSELDSSDYVTLRENLLRNTAAARAVGLSRIPTIQSLRVGSAVTG